MKVPKIVIVMENSRAWERGLIAGIAKYAHLHGPWNFLKKPVFFMEDKKANFYKEIVQFNPDGIIMRELPDSEKIIKLGKPTVISPINVKAFARVANIVENCEGTGRMAAEHLLSKGLKNFAYCGLGDMFWSLERCAGFVKRIEREGLEVAVYKQPKRIQRKNFEEELPFLAKWLHNLPKPVGLMCCIDERSEQVTEICKTEGIHIPEEIALIGVDNDDTICNLSSPPLSSIAFDAQGVGYEAAKMLDQIMKGASTEAVVVTEPAYVVQRQSTDLMAIEDYDVASAIRYIREHSNRKISVEDVARAAALPRRTLERRFHNEVGNSIYKEIQNERIERIEKLLTQTDSSISEIAYSLGFSCPNELTRFYCRYRKISPSSYKQKIKGVIQGR